MTNKPQRRGRSYRNESKGPGIGLENIRWSAVIVTGLLIVVLLFAAVFGIRACAARPCTNIIRPPVASGKENVSAASTERLSHTTIQQRPVDAIGAEAIIIF